MVVPHENREIGFDARIQGPSHYRSVGRELLARNLKVPIGDYTAHLLHASYCNPKTKNEPEFEEIRNSIMKHRWLWVFNRNLWTYEGVYVVPDFNAIGTIQSISIKPRFVEVRQSLLNQNELEKMLKGGKELSWGGIRFSKDKSVRFAPKGSYELGKHTPESLAKDGFVIAGHSSRGAEELGEVSLKIMCKPETYGVNIQEGQNSEQKVSALRKRGYDNKLGVLGNCHGSLSLLGHAFGVLK